MYLSFKSVCNKEHKGVHFVMTLYVIRLIIKVPYITAKMIFTQFIKDLTVNTQKMLVSPSDISTLPVGHQCFGKNHSSFLVFTHNYEQMSGIFVRWSYWNVFPG